MINQYIGDYEIKDIQVQVRKIIKGLGNPEPPLDLRDVRELLKLDRKYYSSTDDGILQEYISKLKIAGKQILKRPALLGEIIRKAKLSALWLPDRKRILIDANVPKLKHRWCEGHEVNHGIIPWHCQYLFGDSKDTLSQSCYEQLEREANYGTGQLLFLMDRFQQEALDYPPTLKTVIILSKKFGNTMTSTLWRFVEEAHKNLPVLGVISQHPSYLNNEFDNENPCKYFIRSSRFAEEFGSVSETQIFENITGYCNSSRGGFLGEEELVIKDDNGEEHIFKFQSFSNRYEVLTLAVYHCKVNVIVSPKIFIEGAGSSKAMRNPELAEG
ncbi:MAG: DUF955 domain-containing protein [Thermodesulfobacteriota bacterium]